MKYQCLTVGLLWILSMATNVVVSSRGNLVEKSYQRATFECNQYVGASTQCQARCEALVLRSWNDSSGLQYIPYSRHFQPDCNDVNYLNRTLQCLDDRLEAAPCGAVCCRASIYKQCYLEQWGNLVGTPQLVPMAKLVVTSTILQCAQLLQVDAAELDFFARNKFDVSDRARCLLRCILIRQGLFSGASEPNLDRLYVQCGGYKLDEETFKRGASACVDKIRHKGYDSCMFVARIVNDCFTMETGPLLGLIVGALLASGVASLLAAAIAYSAVTQLASMAVGEVLPYLATLGIEGDQALVIFNAIDAASGAFENTLEGGLWAAPEGLNGGL
ncbi:hypothetical protein RP20_CCG007857 [Aedes albopictus]|nr:hypothetical protein RP20_CCG007857 [Aedes albopictus]